MEKNVKYRGVLNLGEMPIPCYVLEDGTRVLSGRGMQEALKMVDEAEEGRQTAGTRLSRYLSQKSLNPFIYKDKEEDHFKPIICNDRETKINGYEATVLVDICDAFLEARQAINLSPRQEIIAAQCEILVRAFAKVGIVALVDEATGYQQDKNRAKDELQKFLSQFISDEASRWVKTFNDSFFEMIYRMHGWNWTMTHKRPGVVGYSFNVGGNTKAVKGLYLEPAIGIDFNLKNKQAIYFTVGYAMQHSEYVDFIITETDQSQDYYKDLAGAISIKIGFKF